MRALKNGAVLYALAHCCLSVAAADEPLTLTAAQLDAVSAGYVALGIEATAEASGPNPIAVTFTDTGVQVGSEGVDGFVYTEADGIGYAYARGETAHTDIAVYFDTDEQVVSSDFLVFEHSGVSGGHGALPNGESVPQAGGHGGGHAHGGGARGSRHDHGRAGPPDRYRHGGRPHGGHRHGHSGTGRPAIRTEVTGVVIKVVTRQPAKP